MKNGGLCILVKQGVPTTRIQAHSQLKMAYFAGLLGSPGRSMHMHEFIPKPLFSEEARLSKMWMCHPLANVACCLMMPKA